METRITDFTDLFDYIQNEGIIAEIWAIQNVIYEGIVLRRLVSYCIRRYVNNLGESEYFFDSILNINSFNSITFTTLSSLLNELKEIYVIGIDYGFTKRTVKYYFKFMEIIKKINDKCYEN